MRVVPQRKLEECYAGPIHQVRDHTEINSNHLDLRVHPDTIRDISAQSHTEEQFMYNLAKQLYRREELLNRNYTGARGTLPRRKHALEHCVSDMLGKDKVKLIGTAVSDGIRNMSDK